MLTLIITLLEVLGAGFELILALLPCIIIIGVSKVFMFLCSILI